MGNVPRCFPEDGAYDVCNDFIEEASGISKLDVDGMERRHSL